MSNYYKLSVLILLLLFLNGCRVPNKSEDKPIFLNNNSDYKIEILINRSYPDSSLHKSSFERYMNPKSSGSFAGTSHLLLQDGVTVILFDYNYVQSKWHKDVGRPDTYLEEDKILKRFVLSRNQLDSLGWKLNYP